MAASEMVRGWRMAEKRRALGRGLGALIPSAPSGGAGRPVDVCFTEQKQAEPTTAEASEAPSSADSLADLTTRAIPDASSAPASGSDAAVSVVETTSSGLAVVPGAEFAELNIDSIRPNP